MSLYRIPCCCVDHDRIEISQYVNCDKEALEYMKDFRQWNNSLWSMKDMVLCSVFSRLIILNIPVLVAIIDDKRKIILPWMVYRPFPPFFAIFYAKSGIQISDFCVMTSSRTEIGSLRCQVWCQCGCCPVVSLPIRSRGKKTIGQKPRSRWTWHQRQSTNFVHDHVTTYKTLIWTPNFTKKRRKMVENIQSTIGNNIIFHS